MGSLVFWGLTVLGAESLAAEIEYEFSGDLSDSLLLSTITSYIAIIDPENPTGESYENDLLLSPQFAEDVALGPAGMAMTAFLYFYFAYDTLANVGELYYSNTPVSFDLIPDF